MSVVLLADDWPVACKAHQCDVCLGVIAPGDRYRRQRLVDDYPYVFKAHALCDAAYWKAHEDLELWYDEVPEYDEVVPLLIGAFALLLPPWVSR